jgi:hypothetical protein
MSMINPYASVADFQAYVTPRGQTIGTDATDDATVADLLSQAARTIDSLCGRSFYPRIETRLYDIPECQNDGRIIYLDDDLLDLTTLTNGDLTVITTADYNLKPKNAYPKWGVCLKDASSVTWTVDSSGNDEDVISVAGVWGYRQQYNQRGWLQAGTLGAAVANTTGLSLTITTGHTLAKDTIIKIDSEIFMLTATGATSGTVLARGDNGSTAATHLISAPIYTWQVQPEIKQATVQLAAKLYIQRLGITTVFTAENGKPQYPDFDVSMFKRLL